MRLVQVECDTESTYKARFFLMVSLLKGAGSSILGPVIDATKGIGIFVGPYGNDQIDI